MQNFSLVSQFASSAHYFELSNPTTILHALYECTDEYKIWKYFFEVIKKLSSAAKMTSTSCIFILNALVKDKKTRKLLLTIHITKLSEIWKARNLLKYQTKSPTNDVIIKKIKTKLKRNNKNKFSKAFKTRNLRNF